MIATHVQRAWAVSAKMRLLPLLRAGAAMMLRMKTRTVWARTANLLMPHTIARSFVSAISFKAALRSAAHHRWPVTLAAARSLLRGEPLSVTMILLLPINFWATTLVPTANVTRSTVSLIALSLGAALVILRTHVVRFVFAPVALTRPALGLAAITLTPRLLATRLLMLPRVRTITAFWTWSRRALAGQTIGGFVWTGRWWG